MAWPLVASRWSTRENTLNSVSTALKLLILLMKLCLEIDLNEALLSCA